MYMIVSFANHGYDVLAVAQQSIFRPLPGGWLWAIIGGVFQAQLETYIRENQERTEFRQELRKRNLNAAGETADRAAQ